VVALIRPDDWNFPLLLHTLGAMTLVGALVLAASALLLARRDGDAASLTRLGYRSLLLGALPSWVVMRGGAEWIAEKEDLRDSNAAWIEIGFQTADGGFLFLVIATVLAAFAMRRIARADQPGRLDRISGLLVSLLLVAYVVSIWAMTTKPD
jgi:hypothetical protein